MIETTDAGLAQPGQRLRAAAEALVARYPTASAAETEAAIALLALWALDALEGGPLSASEADSVFTLLDIEIDESRDGPELSEATGQLLLEGMSLHDWGTPFAANVDRMRSLAFNVLTAAH